MEIDPEQLTVRQDEANSRYEIEYGGKRAELVYRMDGDRIVHLHTGVPAELEGHGIAGRLAKFALDDARAKGLMVVPSCPYVRAYIEKNPEYEDLVAPRR